MLGTKIRVGIQERPTVHEGGAVARIKVALCSEPFSEQHSVRIQFHMPVLDPFAWNTDNRDAIHQLFCLDQHAIAPARMQIGQTDDGSGYVEQSMLRCPSQRTARVFPEWHTTWSLILKASIGTSPRTVRIRVPRT